MLFQRPRQGSLGFLQRADIEHPLEHQPITVIADAKGWRGRP